LFTSTGTHELFDQVAANKRRTMLLIFVFVLVVAAAAAGVAALLSLGGVGMIVVLVIAAAVAFAACWKSDSIALAMSHAKEVSEADAPRLHNVVDGLCIAVGLEKPRIYLIEDSSPNAFATGRNPRKSAVAVTTGLLDKMDRIELEAVMAHELSHIRNYDTLVMTVAVTMVGFVALLSDLSFRFLWWGGPRHRDDRKTHSGIGVVVVVLGFVMVVFAPIAARLLQLAISRRREFLADVSGVEMTRYPPGLISALEKLKNDSTVVHSASKATAHLWIENPLATRDGEGKQVRLNRLFNTHPSIDDRIDALREL
jgi:heat shock protein HtpX